MKKFLSTQANLKLNKLNIFFSSALLCHSLAVQAANELNYGLAHNEAYNHVLVSNAFDQPEHGGYNSLGQFFFPIEHAIETSASSHKGELSRIGEQANNTENMWLAQTEPQVPVQEPTPSTQSSQLQNTLPQNASQNGNQEQAVPKTILINFNNVGIIEFIRFISRATNKNFVFDENDLQFNVTIISEEPTSLENVMTALLQELRIHDLSLLEQGNNLIIHKNARVNAVSQVVSDDSQNATPQSEIVTQVFRLNTADPHRVASVIRPLSSEFAIIEVLEGTNHLIITDLSTNVAQISKLIKSVDAPNSGLVIGQYVAKTTAPDALIDMAQRIISPISQDQPLTLVPWEASNSVFIVSTPYLMERTLSILQHIDQNQKSTKIFDLQDLKFREQNNELPRPRLSLDGVPYNPSREEIESKTSPGWRGNNPNENRTLPFQGSGDFGQWRLNSEGNWVLQLKPDPNAPSNQPPTGQWEINPHGDWTFSVGPVDTTREELLGAPKGQWYLEPSGSWTYRLDEGESTNIRRLSRQAPENAAIPLGSRKRSLFSLYKLQYRRGDAIQKSLQSIAGTLLANRDVDPSLIDTLTSVQWLETSNSLIFTGYRENLLKMRALMHEIDTPLRQVFIEMLILETTIDDAMEYSVTWGTRFSGENWAGGEGFNQSSGPNIISPLNGTLNLAGTNNGLGPTVVNNLFSNQGLNIGVVGQKLINTALGVEYHSIGALLQAIRVKSSTNVILNPKIITEDSVPAEIFVGENISFKTQSISNDLGNNITSNFQYRDVGTRLRVTPTLGNNDIITLDIAQEISAVIPTANSGSNINNQPQGPNTTKSTTTTRVHLPSGYFLIISGMMRDERDQAALQVPCLGALPVIGAAFKDKAYTKSKRNQMIFIRPLIIETEEEIQNLTKHQQDIWEFKKRYPVKNDWVYETEEALDFLNLRRSKTVETSPFLPDEDF